jgi:hypothetical protein
MTHHVKEEEQELFPKLEKTELDLDALGQAPATRKREVMVDLGIADEAEEPADPQNDALEKTSPPAKSKGSKRRSGNRVTAR